MAGAKKGHHHGDLRNALIDTVIELIGESGVQSFSLAEAGRRLGVSVAAPYRHFAYRDAVLAAIAVRAGETLGAALAADIRPADDPAEQLAAAARTYVRFAAEHRPLFQALSGSGLDKERHPEIGRAAKPVFDAFTTPAQAICGPDRTEAAAELTLGVVAAAHGCAVLLLDGTFGGAGAVDRAVRRAGAAARAIARDAADRRESV